MGKVNQFNVLLPEVDIDSFGNVRKNTKKTKKEQAPSTSTNKAVKKPKTVTNNVPTKKKIFAKDDSHRSELGAGPQKKLLDEILYFMKTILIATLSTICMLMWQCMTSLGDQLFNLAFNTNPKKVPKQGGSTAQKPSSATVSNKTNVKKAKNKAAKADTEEDWKKRDDVYIKDINDKNLEEAILLSKLEDQKRLANGPSQNKENHEVKEPEELKKKKKKKPTTISLDEFQRATPQELVNKKKPLVATITTDVPKKKSKKVKDKFFEEVKESAKSTLLREKQQEQYRKILKIEDRKAMEVRFTGEVEKRDFEIQALQLEVDSLKSELINVKQRNKKLCEVIGSSEMKPKGELVVQLEKASKTRDEYSEEVSKLSAELEQEKTKVSNLNQEIKKLQGRRKTDN